MLVFVPDEPEHRDIENGEAHEWNRTGPENVNEFIKNEESDDHHGCGISPDIVAPERTGNKDVYGAMRYQIEPADDESFVRLRSQRAQVGRKEIVGVVDDRVPRKEKDDVAEFISEDEQKSEPDLEKSVESFEDDRDQERAVYPSFL